MLLGAAKQLRSRQLCRAEGSLGWQKHGRGLNNILNAIYILHFINKNSFYLFIVELDVQVYANLEGSPFGADLVLIRIWQASRRPTLCFINRVYVMLVRDDRGVHGGVVSRSKQEQTG